MNEAKDFVNSLNAVKNAQSEAELSLALANELVRRTTDEKSKLVQLEMAFLEACMFLNVATDKIPESWTKFLTESKRSLEEVRMWRMAMEREVNQGMAAMKDITAFLGSEDTAKRLKVLRELVELAERLQKLKLTGFLDAMVDTMLKVPCNETKQP